MKSSSAKPTPRQPDLSHLPPPMEIKLRSPAWRETTPHPATPHLTPGSDGRPPILPEHWAMVALLVLAFALGARALLAL